MGSSCCVPVLGTLGPVGLISYMSMVDPCTALCRMELLTLITCLTLMTLSGLQIQYEVKPRDNDHTNMVSRVVFELMACCNNNAAKDSCSCTIHQSRQQHIYQYCQSDRSH